MGCTNSKDVTRMTRQQSKLENTVDSANKNNPLTEKEILQRIECPVTTQKATIAQNSYSYAWVSQRGYYPDSPDKENQDTFSIIPNYGNSNQAYFAVYDGHGKEGHLCSQFTRDTLPQNILNRLSKVIDPSDRNIQQALTVAHFTTNDSLHACSIDDSLSGTTSISVFFRQNRIYVSNVGDSRAIIGSTTADGRVIAKPMSSDQTPYRKDERERVKKHGARILSMDQIEGIEPIHEDWGNVTLGEEIDEGGDPPRVWSQHGDYPGTAFTRSFGDMYAEELGVSAEPEIFVKDITKNDKFIIIASDGVFEFLTNQMVIDMVMKYHDPLEACKAVVNAAYNMWLQYEVRTDDITVIAIFIDEVKNNTFNEINLNNSDSTTSLSNGNNSVNQLDSRPVRRAISRERRKTMIHVESNDMIESQISSIAEVDVSSLIIEKSDSEKTSIEGAIKSNFLFQHLNQSQRQTVIDVMEPLNVNTGDWVIRQGDKGDRFYVIDSGIFEVRVQMPGGNDPNGGNVVHVYTGGPDQHPGFGELSLMYGKPRAASVIALTTGRLWALDRNVFRKVVMRSMDARKGIVKTLKHIDIFKCLNIQQMQRLTDLLVEEIYPPNHYIIRQNEIGENFYLIVKGECDCTINKPNDLDNNNNSSNNDDINIETTIDEQKDGTIEEILVMKLSDNQYFGEKALLTANPRAANVITRTETKVLYINKAAFEEVLGPLSAIIDRDRQRREALALLGNNNGPQRYEDMHILGIVSSDPASTLLLGTFNKEINKDESKNNSSVSVANLSIRSFILSELDRLHLSNSLITSVEAARVISTSLAVIPNKFIPKLLNVVKTSNAIHLIYETPVVCDVSTIVTNANIKAGYLPSHDNDNSNKRNSGHFNPIPQQPLKQEVVAYIAGCVILGLEYMHDLGIVYRAVQPESISVTSNGLIQLFDFRMCKVGLMGGRTYTICGAADYLAPEQISQRGHGTAVDLWALGVLMYELSVGIHPFASSSEVATYSKITSYGSKAFPYLNFPDYVSQDMKLLINQLLIPTPEQRLGSCTMRMVDETNQIIPHRRASKTFGYDGLKRHNLFKSIDWKQLSSMKSPLLTLANSEFIDLSKDGITGTDKELIDMFDKPYNGDIDWNKHIDLD